MSCTAGGSTPGHWGGHQLLGARDIGLAAGAGERPKVDRLAVQLARFTAGPSPNSGKLLKVKNPEGAGYAWLEEDQLPQQPGLPRLRDLPAMHGQSIPLRVPSRERCCIGLPGCATIGNRGLDHHYLSSQTFLVEGSSERIPNQISKIIVQKMASTLDDEGTRQRGDDLFIVGILTWTGNTVVTRSRQMCLTAARIRGLSSTRT